MSLVLRQRFRVTEVNRFIVRSVLLQDEFIRMGARLAEIDYLVYTVCYSKHAGHLGRRGAILYVKAMHIHALIKLSHTKFALKWVFLALQFELNDIAEHVKHACPYGLYFFVGVIGQNHNFSNR